MGTLAGFKIGNFWNLPLICTMDLHQDLCRCLHNILADCLHQYTPEAQFSNLLKILSQLLLEPALKMVGWSLPGSERHLQTNREIARNNRCR